MDYILYVCNLPFNISCEKMYYIFRKYGVIRKIQTIINKDIKGTTIMVCLRIQDAKKQWITCQGLIWRINIWLFCIYYQQVKMSKKFNQKKKEEEIAKMVFLPRVSDINNDFFIADT